MNGVTGRMGTNQHLLRSMAEIIKQGGVKIGGGETIMPDPILVGRDLSKLEKLRALSDVKRISTNLAETLADPSLRRNIAIAGAKTAKEKLSLKAMTDQYVALLEA